VEAPSTVLQPPGTDPVARAEALLALTDLLARTTGRPAPDDGEPP
jgi:hypothetical protein